MTRVEGDVCAEAACDQPRFKPASMRGRSRYCHAHYRERQRRYERAYRERRRNPMPAPTPPEAVDTVLSVADVYQRWRPLPQTGDAPYCDVTYQGRRVWGLHPLPDGDGYSAVLAGMDAPVRLAAGDMLERGTV